MVDFDSLTGGFICAIHRMALIPPFRNIVLSGIVWAYHDDQLP